MSNDKTMIVLISMLKKRGGEANRTPFLNLMLDEEQYDVKSLQMVREG